MPALKCLSEEQYKTFHKTLLLLVRMDKKLDLFELQKMKSMRLG